MTQLISDPNSYRRLTPYQHARNSILEPSQAICSIYPIPKHPTSLEGMIYSCEHKIIKYVKLPWTPPLPTHGSCHSIHSIALTCIDQSNVHNNFQFQIINSPFPLPTCKLNLENRAIGGWRILVSRCLDFSSHCKPNRNLVHQHCEML